MIRNRYMESGSPCLRPFLHLIHLQGNPFRRTVVWPVSRMSKIHCRKEGEETSGSKHQVKGLPRERVKGF